MANEEDETTYMTRRQKALEEHLGLRDKYIKEYDDFRKGLDKTNTRSMLNPWNWGSPGTWCKNHNSKCCPPVNNDVTSFENFLPGKPKLYSTDFEFDEKNSNNKMLGGTTYYWYTCKLTKKAKARWKRSGRRSREG